MTANHIGAPGEEGVMGIWERLKSALGGGTGGGSDRDGLYLYVRCGRCGDVVRVRVNLANELQQEFSGSGGISGYALRKVVVVREGVECPSLSRMVTRLPMRQSSPMVMDR